MKATKTKSKVSTKKATKKTSSVEDAKLNAIVERIKNSPNPQKQFFNELSFILRS